MQELLRSSSKLIGMRQVLRNIATGSLLKVFIAQDADSFLKNKVISACEQNNIPYDVEYTKKQMGDFANIQVDAAVIGICR